MQEVPGAPLLQVTTVVAPAHSSFTLALAIESASVTITGDVAQLDTALPSLEQPARNAVNATNHNPGTPTHLASMSRSDPIVVPTSTANQERRERMRHHGRTRPRQ